MVHQRYTIDSYKVLLLLLQSFTVIFFVLQAVLCMKDAFMQTMFKPAPCKECIALRKENRLLRNKLIDAKSKLIDAKSKLIDVKSKTKPKALHKGCS